MRHSSNSRSRGFSMIELLISMSIFLGLSAAILSSIANTQQRRQSNEIRANLEDKVRAASELLLHDVGQAGKNYSPDAALVATTTSYSDVSTSKSGNYTNNSGSTACDSASGSFYVTTVKTNSPVANLYLGEAVLLGTGALQEEGWICGTTEPSTQTSAPYTLTIMRGAGVAPTGNTAGVAIYPAGVFAEGILSQQRSLSAPYPSLASSSSTLFLIGDIDESGTLVLVRYACSNTNTSAAGGGTLTRTVWPLNAAANTAGTTATLLDNVACYFKYSDDVSSNALTHTAGVSDHIVTYNVVQAVNIYLTASSDTNDSTGKPYTVTKSYENIQPRNLINAGLNNTASVLVQWTPTNPKWILASTTASLP